MKLRFLHGPWPFAIAGALLILSSTFILGVITFKAEQALLKTQKELEANKSQLQVAQQNYDMAQMQVSLAVLQRSVIRSSVVQNVNLQKMSQRGYAETLFAALLRLYIAAGKDVIGQEQVADLKRICSEAIEGNNIALEKLNGRILDTVLISDKYRQDLLVKKSKIEKDADVTLPPKTEPLQI